MKTIELSQFDLALEHGITAITPCAESAAAQRLAHESRRRLAGLEVWVSPDIVGLGGWLARTWESVQVAGIDDRWVMSAHQERSLWEQVVTASPRAGTLLHPRAAAKAGFEAANLAWQWRISANRLPDDAGADTDALKTWWREVDAWLRHHRAIAAEQLPEWLVRLGAFPGGAKNDAGEVWWLGFAAPTPTHRLLDKWLRETGISTCWCQLGEANAQDYHFAARDQDEEREFAVQAVCSQLTSGAPQASLALADASGMPVLRRRLEDCLETLTERGELSGPVSLAASDDALLALPCIRNALDLLRSVAGVDLSQPELLGLVASPRLDLPPPLRAAARQRLDRRRTRRLGFASLLNMVSAEAGFAPRLRFLMEHEVNWPRSATPSQWAEHFAALLHQVAWWRARTETTGGQASAMIALADSFDQALSRLGELDEVVTAISARVALEHLRRILAGLAPQRDSTPYRVYLASVHTVFPLPGGLVWLLGMEAGNWPVGARPNGLLPVSLQRQVGIPAASAEGQFELAQLRLELLRTGSSVLVTSHAEQRGDEPALASGLVAAAPAWTPAARLMAAPAIALEAAADPAVPLVQAGGTVSSNLLQEQSGCPFRAFARYRLEQQEFSAPEDGLGTVLRGNLLHAVLERVWQTIKGRAGLDDITVGETVRQVASEEVARYQREFAEFGDRYRLNEVDRLVQLVDKWLEVERQRDDFEIAGLEQEIQGELGPLAFKLRLDRVDRVPDGLIVIDYKSGAKDRHRLPGQGEDRPEQPQLPLYAVLTPQTVAVAYAIINADCQEFHGLADSSTRLPKVREAEDWPARLDDWRSSLVALAEAYVAGHAAVDPLDERICSYCDYAALCRIRGPAAGGACSAA